MSEMLTAKEVQAILQVDRSTIYRMAESGRLPAVKVGKQWRFPAEKIENWFQLHSSSASVEGVGRPTQTINGRGENLAELLPLECVQLIQNTFADLLGVMLIVTDMEGNPITDPSRPCGLFQAVNETPHAVQRCIQSWSALATTIDLEPKFSRSHLGLLCTRAMIRVGTRLKGMVVAGCVAPDDWPPATQEIEQIASGFGVEPLLLIDHIGEVFYLDEAQRAVVLANVQRIANIIAHIVNERRTLMGRLEAIAHLTTL
jgi:excisionase family DNA binding protein